jgi:hypothetical protein
MTATNKIAVIALAHMGAAYMPTIKANIAATMLPHTTKSHTNSIHFITAPNKK